MNNIIAKGIEHIKDSLDLLGEKDIAKLWMATLSVIMAKGPPRQVIYRLAISIFACTDLIREKKWKKIMSRLPKGSADRDLVLRLLFALQLGGDIVDIEDIISKKLEKLRFEESRFAHRINRIAKIKNLVKAPHR